MKCTYWNNFCFNPGNLKLEIIENKAKLVNDAFGGLEILIIWGKSLWTLVCPFVIERWPFNSGIPLLALGRAWGCAPCWFLIGDRGYWQGHQPAWGISSQPLLHLDRCVWPGWGLLPPGVCTWGYNFGGGFCGLFFFFSYHLGFFSTKKYPAKERWDLLKGRKFVFFIIACPTPNTIHSTLVVSCSIVSDSLQPHELLAHQAPLSMEFSR